MLPGNWGSTIKRIFLIIELIIAVPIIFDMFALIGKIFKLMCWCYKPVISGINHEISNMGALVTSSAVGLRDLARRMPYWRLHETSKVETSVVRYDRGAHEAVTLRTLRLPSRAPKSRSNVQLDELRRAANASFSGY